MSDPITIALGLAKAAPMVARWLGGDKAEAVAEKVVEIAEKVTGKKGEGAAAVIEADPNLAVIFQREVLAADAELERLYLADRADARARDVALVQAGGRNLRADLLAGAAVLMVAGMVWVLVAYAPEAGAVRDTLFLIVGALLAVLKDVYQFEFGSSRGSKEKADALARLGR